MTSQPEFKSDAFAAIHTSASALQEVGAIDEATMREFDETCLVVPEKCLPDDAGSTQPTATSSRPVR